MNDDLYRLARWSDLALLALIVLLVIAWATGTDVPSW